MTFKNLLITLFFVSLLCVHPVISADVDKDATANPTLEKEKPRQEITFDQLMRSIHDQLHEFDNFFERKMSRLRERFMPMSIEDWLDRDLNLSNLTKIEPNYALSYSTSSVYRNGTQDIREHIEIKNPEMKMIADKVPERRV
jgi:hypothetical protein